MATAFLSLLFAFSISFAEIDTSFDGNQYNSSGSGGSWDMGDGSYNAPGQTQKSPQSPTSESASASQPVGAGYSAPTLVQPNMSAPRIFTPHPVAPTSENPEPSGQNAQGTSQASHEENVSPFMEVIQNVVTGTSRINPFQFPNRTDPWTVGRTGNENSSNTGRPSGEQELQKKLEDIANTAHRLETEIQNASNAFTNVVSEGIDSSLKKVENIAPAGQPSETIPQTNEPESKSFQELREKISDKQQQLSSDVRKVLTTNTPPEKQVTELDTIVQSSFRDIEALIKAETGVSVSLDAPARPVVEQIVQSVPALKEEIANVRSGAGLSLYADSDKDGVSDFDEVNIYETDPKNPYTGGSSLTDGERILVGLDARTSSATFVPVESPIVTGLETRNIFQVEKIESIAVSAPTLEKQEPTQALVFSGKALPNSFVTLYIFSTPIVVTVKTDSEGKWHYTLDKELENGAHELHVAMVNNEGRIIAKSPPVPFVKTAEAVEYTPLLAPVSSNANSIETIRTYFIGLAAMAFSALALIALIMLGMWKQFREKEKIAP